jgi:hypothetical protein
MVFTSMRRFTTNRGAALVVVLAALLLLSFLAALATSVTRSSAQLAAALSDQARWRAAADGAIEQAVDRLSTGVVSLAGEGASFEQESLGMSFHILIRDESGKVDVNAAPTDLVRRVLRAARAPSGISRTTYNPAGSEVSPSGHTPFILYLGDVGRSSSLTSEDFALLKQRATVYTGLDAIDRRVAQADLVDGGTEAIAAGVGTSEVGGTSDLAGHVVEIVASATTKSSLQHCRRTTVRLTGDKDRPYLRLDSEESFEEK